MLIFSNPKIPIAVNTLEKRAKIFMIPPYFCKGYCGPSIFNYTEKFKYVKFNIKTVE